MGQDDRFVFILEEAVAEEGQTGLRFS